MRLRRLVQYLLTLTNIYLPIANSALLLIGIHTLQKMRYEYAYDTDAARHRYRVDVERYYMMGCRQGTEWEPTPNVVGYNRNSRVNYCYDTSLQYEDLFNHDTYNFIRKEYSR